jgi:hypothetical protein
VSSALHGAQHGEYAYTSNTSGNALCSMHSLTCTTHMHSLDALVANHPHTGIVHARFIRAREGIPGMY